MEMLIYILAGFLSLAYLIKIWIMCNNVRDIKSTLTKSMHYRYGEDTSLEAFQRDIDEVEELIFCEQFSEAKYRLKKMEYSLNKEKAYYQEKNFVDEETLTTKTQTIERLLNIVISND